MLENIEEAQFVDEFDVRNAECNETSWFLTALCMLLKNVNSNVIFYDADTGARYVRVCLRRRKGTFYLDHWTQRMLENIAEAQFDDKFDGRNAGRN